MTIAKIFTVPAGSDTFYVTCNTSGTATFTTFDRHLDLLFVPTQYGTVTEQGGEAVDEYGSFVLAPPMTPADYEAEYTESVAANLARIQAELDAIQAQMDAAAAELVNNP
jgi:hypothetical protein